MRKGVNQIVSFVLALSLCCSTMAVPAQAALCEDTSEFDEILEPSPSLEPSPAQEEDADKPDQITPPTFLLDLEDSVRYVQGDVATPLQVEAISYNGGTISYQWYSSIHTDPIIGQPILGAIESSFTPDTAQIGTTYYYAVALNALEDGQTVSVSSNIITVVVDERPIEITTPIDTKEDSASVDNTDIQPEKNDDSESTVPDTIKEPEIVNDVITDGITDTPAELSPIDVQTMNRGYYEQNVLDAPLMAFGAYALTGDQELTERLHLSTSFSGTKSAYMATTGFYLLGSAEATAAIDTMVRGEDPRNYKKLIGGVQSEVSSDLIAEILDNLQEDGTFKYTTKKPNAYAIGITDTYSLFALEMYFGGTNWSRTGGNEHQTRAGVIGKYFERFCDAKYRTTWEFVEGRMLGPTKAAGTMGSCLFCQLDAAMLLTRWLDDDTVVKINGESQVLKDIAKKELDGMLRVFDVSANPDVNNEKYTGTITEFSESIRTDMHLPRYISLLIATGQKEKVDQLHLMADVLKLFVTQDLIDSGIGPSLNQAHLGAYYTPASAPYVSKTNVWIGSVALGDYLHGTAALSTFIYTPPIIPDEDSVSNDLDMLDLPSTALGALTLPTSGVYGSEISWTSSAPVVIDPETGEVTIPESGKPAVTVILTATVKKGDHQSTKTFAVSVMPQSESNVKAAVNLDANALTIHLFTTSDLELPATGTNGSTITWKSSDPSVITDTGVVNRSNIEQKATMTATITKSSETTSATETKSFEVTVGKTYDESDLVTKTVYQIRETYQENRNLTASYWSVWIAKSVLRDDFDQYNFSVYNLKQHKPGRNWAGTDIGAAILQIVAQGDNPYNYQGINYVDRLKNYLNKPSMGGGYNYFWGTFTEPIFLVLGLEAAGAMTPEYAEGLKRCSGMMHSIGNGADYGGWATVPVSNYVVNHPSVKDIYAEDFQALNQICMEALVKDLNDEQYGFIGSEPYEGYSAAVGSNSVLIGSVGAKKAGFENWDLNGAEWTVDGKSLQTRIYEHFFAGAAGADGNFKNQPCIAFGDLYYGSNVWTSENPTQAKLTALLQDAKGKLDNKNAYTSATIKTLQTAYNSAIAVKDQEYNFGEQYFALKDALKNLKEIGSTTVTVLGKSEQDTKLDAASVEAENGSYLDVLQAAAVQYGMSFTPASSTVISEFGGLTASGSSVWCLYDGGKRVTDFNSKPEDGADLTLKYCANGASGATLQEQLVNEAMDALDLGDTTSVSTDLSLPSSGMYGTSIVWNSDKPLALTNAGKVTQGRYDVRVILTATINGSDGETSEKKTFTVIVKGSTAVQKQQKAYISVVDPKGKTYLKKTEIEIEPGDTAYTVLKKTNLFLDVDEHSEYGVYVRAIEGWGEFSDGNKSGWMYRVTHNGKTSFPGRSAALEPIEDGDYVEWLFTRDLGKDLGNSWDEDKKQSEEVLLTPSATIDRNGSASVTVSAYDLLSTIEEAVSAKASSVVIAPSIRRGVSQVSLSVPKSSASELVYQTNASLVIETPTGNITIPNSALSAIISSARGSDINIDISEHDSSYAEGLILSQTQQYTREQLKSAAVIQVTFESGGRSITSFNSRSVMIDLPVSGSDFSSGTWYDILHVSSDGVYDFEKLSGKCFRENGQLYVPVTVSHLSTFVVLPATATTTTSTKVPFTDVTVSDWFYDEVAYVYQKGLFNGDTPNTFAPYNDMDRAMLVTVLHRYEGTPTPARANSFSDVPAGQWFTNGVAWANYTGVVNGKGNGKFAPYDSITREEIAVILYRYAKIKGWDVTASASLSGFYDAYRVSDWATRAVQWANAKGILNGKGGGMLDPGGNATRAEVAAMLMRFTQAY